MSSSGNGLVVEQVEGVKVLTLNRPEVHNAIDDGLYEALCDTVAAIDGDRCCRAVVLRGAGRSFCSGRDTSQLGRNVRGADFVGVRRAQRLNRLVRGLPQPVIACLKGHVIGKGLELATAADVRLAGRSASLSLPEVRFGLITDNAGAAAITLAAGPARAKYLLMSGSPVDADRALSWGLVEWVVPDDDLDLVALDLALEIARRPPLAVAMAKRVVDAVHEGRIDAGFDREMLAQLLLFHSEDHAAARAGRDQFEGR